jgi:hypothetical protein
MDRAESTLDIESERISPTLHPLTKPYPARQRILHPLLLPFASTKAADTFHVSFSYRAYPMSFAQQYVIDKANELLAGLIASTLPTLLRVLLTVRSLPASL